MKSVSQFSIMSFEGLVPSSPIEPVTKGRSSGNAALPLSALATPHPKRSATSLSSSAASKAPADRKSTRLNPSHANISYAVFCLKKKKKSIEKYEKKKKKKKNEKKKKETKQN